MKSGVGCLVWFLLVLNAVSTAAAASVNYIYDDLNRLVEARYSDTFTIGYFYDFAGNRTRKVIRAQNLKADINADGSVGLDDLILSLRVMAGLEAAGVRSDFISSGVDIPGDLKIGMEDTLYLIRAIGGIRPGE